MELLIIFCLALVNGLLAMSEIAVVSSRRARLKQQIADGRAGARTALELSENPNRFLSTVQVGITTIGILAGAFGGATIANDLAVWLSQFDALAPYSSALSVALVVLFTTYVSLIVGELVPKRLAIQHPEAIARKVAPLMARLSMLAYPLVWFLSASTNIVLFILGVEESNEPEVTEDEIETMLQEGTQAGIFDTAEHKMVAGVFRLGDLHANSLMTPRTDMVWLDIDDTVDVIRKKIGESDHSRYPVCEGDPDKVLGIVRTKDLLRRSLINGSLDLRTLLREPVFIPEATHASDILDIFRKNTDQIAFVLGEHGGTEGIVTLNDVLESIVGDIDEPDAVERDDGSWLIDGMMPIEEFKALIGIKALPDEAENVYRTLAGFVINQQGKIPAPADNFTWDGLYFEVMDMDGNRVDKILVRQIGPLNPAEEEENNGETQVVDNGTSLPESGRTKHQ